MNTDNLDLSEIKWMLFKPVPNQPDFVQFDRNLTIKQFAEEIKARLPKEIRSRLECFAPYQYNDNRKDDAQISGNGKDEYAGNTVLVSASPRFAQFRIPDVTRGVPRATRGLPQAPRGHRSTALPPERAVRGLENMLRDPAQAARGPG